MAAVIGIVFTLALLALFIAGIVAGIIILIHAFKVSVTEGLLCLFVPFYSLFFMFTKFEHPRKVLLIVLALTAPVFAGFFAAIGVYGVRRYLIDAKQAEGRNAVVYFANGVLHYMGSPNATTGEPPAELPPSAPPVPASLSALRGMKYQSVAGEWKQGSWALIGLSMQDPQYFQYQWVRTSATTGVVRALADLNGDGDIDIRLELPIQCGPFAGHFACQAAPKPTEQVQGL